MSVKKWAICAFLFFICYLIVVYLDKNIYEPFYNNRRGLGLRRNPNCIYGNCPFRRDRMNYSRGIYPRFLYPSYWYRYF
jgi:hypothetical protein